MKKTLTTLAFAFLTQITFGQLSSSEGDPRVRKLLNELDYKFMVLTSNDNEFRVEFKLDNGRTQAGFIDSKTSFYGNFEIREISSLVFISKNMPSQNNLYQILKRNATYKIGAFEIILNDSGNYVIRFTAKVSADLDANGLNTILTAVLEISDSLEKELSDIDDN